MNARKAFSLVYMIPATVAILYWLARHPGSDEGWVITLATLGGLALLALSCIVLLPRIVGERICADRYREAAVRGLGLPVFMTSLWGLIFFPLDPAPRLAICLSLAAISFVAVCRQYARQTRSSRR